MIGRSIAARSLAFTALFVSAGCVYHLAGRGSFLPERIKIIGIPPFQSQVAKREVVERLTESVTREFIARGGYRILPVQAGADAVLEGTITGINTTPIAFDTDGRATRALLTISAGVVLRDLKEGKSIYESPAFQFRSELELTKTGTDFVDPESEGIEDISKDFAKSLVSTIVEGF